MQEHHETYESEVVSSLQFNFDGNMFAVGDRGGRIQTFKRDNSVKIPTYIPFVTFQSHTPEFDYLKSIEIEEKISQLKWLRNSGPAHYLLAANDRTIKLWKVGELKKHEYNNCVTRPSTLKKLVIPRPVLTTVEPSSVLRKSYKNGHTFHINTVSVNSDEQTFVSSDDLRINLWDIERTDSSFVIIDLKPENLENLTEVITTCAFHPQHCNILMYSTSRGSTKLCDLRVSALCDNPTKHFREDSGYRGFFSEVVSSIGDAQFSNSGKYIATRDFMTVKIWDTRMDSASLLSIPVHDFLRPHLTTLFENDLIFDKFSVSWNHNDSRICSGSYNDLFCIGEPIISEKPRMKSSLFEVTDYQDTKHHVLKPKRIVLGQGDDKRTKATDDIKIDDMELSRRVLFSQWHPKENVVAAATLSEVSLFHEKRLFL